MDSTAFKGHLLVLADATNKDISAPLGLLWWEKYGGLDDTILLAAFGQALDTCTFFPSPAEFNGIIEAVRRALGQGGPRPEEEVGGLLRKLSRYNPDLGIVNDGTRGLLLARGADRGEDWEGSGFTDRERQVLRLFGGAARAAAWDDKDMQFNRQRLAEAFTALATDDRAAAKLAEAAGRSVVELQTEAARRARLTTG